MLLKGHTSGTQTEVIFLKVTHYNINVPADAKVT